MDEENDRVLRGGAHFAHPRAHPARAAAAIVGGCAALAGLGVGTMALLRAPEAAPGAGAPVANHITVPDRAAAVPLTRDEIWRLVGRAPDFGGVLGDPARRASCLGGLGYPASAPILGARPVEIDARRGVVLVLAADVPDTLAVLAVSPNCSAADTGLLASTQVPRP